MSLPSLSAIDQSLDELAVMAVRADVATVIGVPGAAEQTDNVIGLMRELDPTGERETGSLGAAGQVLKGGIAAALGLGAKAGAALAKAARAVSPRTLAILGATGAVIAVGSQYVAGISAAKLEQVITEDRRIAQVLDSIPPEKRAAALASFMVARQESPGLSIPLMIGGVVAVALLWRMTR